MHQALQLACVWSLAAKDRHLCILPLFHTAGLGLSLGVQVVGGTSVLMSRFDASAAARVIDEYGVSCFASFSPILTGILDAADAQGAGLGSLRALTGADPVAPGRANSSSLLLR